MPADSCPRSLARLSRVPSGSTAPGRATATVCPAATFGAPQTICDGSPAPVSTRQTLSRSASGWRSERRTLPTTKCSSAGDAVRVDASTSVPVIASRVAELERLEPGIAVVVQPEQGQPHPNCSRNRRSFS